MPVEVAAEIRRPTMPPTSPQPAGHRRPGSASPANGLGGLSVAAARSSERRTEAAAFPPSRATAASRASTCRIAQQIRVPPKTLRVEPRPAGVKALTSQHRSLAGPRERLPHRVQDHRQRARRAGFSRSSHRSKVYGVSRRRMRPETHAVYARLDSIITSHNSGSRHRKILMQRSAGPGPPVTVSGDVTSRNLGR